MKHIKLSDLTYEQVEFHFKNVIPFIIDSDSEELVLAVKIVRGENNVPVYVVLSEILHIRYVEYNPFVSALNQIVRYFYSDGHVSEKPNVTLTTVNNFMEDCYGNERN